MLRVRRPDTLVRQVGEIDDHQEVFQIGVQLFVVVAKRRQTFHHRHQLAADLTAVHGDGRTALRCQYALVNRLLVSAAAIA